MKRLALLLAVICFMGFAGFIAGKYFKPTSVDFDGSAQRTETTYKLPLGRFTMQIVKPSRFYNIRFNMDVYITGAANFEKMNGGLARNQMREEILRKLSDMVETTLWVDESNNSDITADQISEMITKRLILTYPMVKTAQISDLASSRVGR